MKNRIFGIAFSMFCGISFSSLFVAAVFAFTAEFAMCQEQESPAKVPTVASETIPASALVNTPVEILFFSGYRISGDLKQMKGDILEMACAGAPSLIKAKTDFICSLYFTSPSNAPALSLLPDSLGFISGMDAIPCKIHELTADYVLLTTDYKEKMSIPRENIAYFSLGAAGVRDIFDGATVIDTSWLNPTQEKHYKETGRLDKLIQGLKPIVQDKNKIIPLSFPMPVLAKDIGLDPRGFDFSVCLDFTENIRRGDTSNSVLTFIFGETAERILDWQPEVARSARAPLGEGSKSVAILLEVGSDEVRLLLRKASKVEQLAQFALDGKSQLLEISLNVRWAGMNQLRYELRVNNALPKVINNVEGMPRGNAFGVFCGSSLSVKMVNPRLSVLASSFVGSEVLTKTGVLTKEEDFLPFEVESLSGEPLLATLKGGEEKGFKTIPGRYIAQVVLNPQNKMATTPAGFSELSLGDASRLQGRVKEIKDGFLLLEHLYLGEISIPLNQINRLLLPQSVPELIKSKP